MRAGPRAEPSDNHVTLVLVRPPSVAAPLALAILVAGCSSRAHPPGMMEDLGGAGAGGTPNDAGFLDIAQQDGPPPLDAAGLCGNEIIPALADPPNLYFVIDRSGSMSDVVDGTVKYVALEKAVVDLVRHVGDRARVGAAVFPGFDAQNSCSTGLEVFPTKLGDSAKYLDSGVDGPVTISFAKAIDGKPYGGTPTAATLAGLYGTLTALAGKTYVVLATDGGPNCDLALGCDASLCMANIEGAPGCTNTTYNCCGAKDPYYGPANCLDADPTKAAVEALADAGIPTYVLGLPAPAGQPGSATYAWLLDELATVGGTARATEPKYYAIDQMSELGQVLDAIGATVVVTCDFTLASPPPDPDLVNVYFDTTVVPRDPTDGWDWTSTTSFSLRGAACDELKSGSVQQVQFVIGCPTKKPN